MTVNNKRISTSFNPRAPCGARQRRASKRGSRGTFQSTRPVWGATVAHEFGEHGIDVSIHAPRVGRDVTAYQCDQSLLVSIHAPRVGRDLMDLDELAKMDVSIHAPRVGRDCDT